MDYEALLRESFRISIRKPHLWFFGFFAGGSTFSVNFTNSGDSGDDSFGFLGTGELALAAQSVPDASGAGATALSVLLVIVLVIVSLILFALLVLSRGALVDSVAVLRQGGVRKFVSTWSAGARNFWRVLLFFLLYIIVFLLVALVTLVPLGFLGWAVWSGVESIALKLILAFFGALIVGLILIVLFLALYIVAQFGLRALIIDQAGVIGAFGRGLDLFRHNLGRSLLIAQIQAAIMVGIVLLLLPVIFFVSFLPLIAFQSALTGDFSAAGLNVALVTIGVLFGIPFLIFSAILGTFNSAYWTIGYQRMTGTVNRASAPENPS
ncbi:hypothetical protein BH23ACT11_BH23ACT11_27740 [soil metagenome]